MALSGRKRGGRQWRLMAVRGLIKLVTVVKPENRLLTHWQRGRFEEVKSFATFRVHRSICPPTAHSCYLVILRHSVQTRELNIKNEKWVGEYFHAF